MKKLIICLSVISLMIAGCSAGKTSPLEGAWELAYEYEIAGDNVTTIFPGVYTGSEMKMWSESHFCFIGLFEQDTVRTDNYGGGTYTLEGTRYEETVEYHSAPEYLGRVVRLYLEIKGDTLVQVWPVDDDGRPVPGTHFMEKWVRLD